MLELKNVSIAYEDEMIVSDVSMLVKQGEIVCIVGESGCGKTSLLKSIMGLLPSQAHVVSGDILYEGESILNLSSSQRNHFLGKELAMVFQDAGLSLNPVRKIGKQFIEYIRTHQKISKEEAYHLAEETLNKMQFSSSEDILNSYTFQLSGGMKQRVGLAFALSLNPSFLLLDEPTSALDVTTQAQIVEEILKLKKNFDTTILMITHNIPLAIYMADYIIVMKAGQIIEKNQAIEIFTNPQQDYTKELLQHIPHLEENDENQNKE